MKIKFLGQNCFLFTYKNINILSDPFYNYQKEHSKFDISAQKIDYVMITHAHEDHIADVKDVLENHPNAVLIGQPEICGYFKHPNFIDLNIGGSTNVEDLIITMVSAAHTSSFPDGSYGGVASGYIIRTPEQIIYLAGDTGLMSDMKEFIEWFGEVSVAILPIGGHYTMNADDAALAAYEYLKTNKVIACHFDTFEKIEIDHEETMEIFEEANVELILPKLGEEIEV